MFWAVYALAVLIFVFSFVLFFGAPYVPTLKKQVDEAFDLLDLKPGQTLIELGSGDGRVLREAARRGIYSIGYELNPFLYIFSMAASLKYRRFITIKYSNYWRSKLPPADALYVFLLDRYMPKLETKITQEITEPLKVVSFTFKFLDRKVTKTKGGMFCYNFKPTAAKALRAK